MITGIDHIVIAVRDLAEASADYARAGFTVTAGGTHTGGKTHNALVTFADGAYFELIALTDPKFAPDHAWFAAIEQWEDYVAFALRSDDLYADFRRVSEAGIPTNGPRDGGRLRPDGTPIAWRSFAIESPAAPMSPFVIQDVTTRELRVPDGTAAEHPLGVTGVAGATVIVGDLASASFVYAALLGPEVESAGTGGVRFALGGHWIDLVQAEDTASERGDSLFEITLAGGAPTGGTLPLDLTHGARIRLDLPR